MLLAGSSHTPAAVACVADSGPAFWLAQLSSCGAPTLLVHTALFPGGVLYSALLCAVAVGLLLLGNPARCAATLGSCPAAGARFSAAVAGLSDATSLLPLQPSAAAASLAADPLRSCVALAAGADVVAYALVLRLAWVLQRASRQRSARPRTAARRARVQ